MTTAVLHAGSGQRLLAQAQQHLTWAMPVAYAAAAVVPQAGRWARHLTCGTPALPGGQVALTPQILLLAYVLFTAALQVRVRELTVLLRRPGLLVAGTAANTALPLVILVLLAGAFLLLPDADGGSGLLTGLALIAAMPVAGGATVWGSRAGGNQTLVVGLVMSSTLLSPVTIPLTLAGASAVTSGDYSAALARMAHVAGGALAAAGVVAPCVAGLAVRSVLPERWAGVAMPWLKLLALAAALTLTYVNASGAFTDLIARPRPALLALATLAAAAMCAASFLLGWCLARALKAAHADTVALTFTSGMNNSSASAVLATTRFPDHPHVLLPILAYSLLQKVLAGFADSTLAGRGGRRTGGQEATSRKRPGIGQKALR
ncbi:bile acid:sodium symporter family protein [Streptomyces pinistramenti]|uniref:bile acid:sodium symporter family protein n=1 Tax=Streptomyces pinistramenti TaxID=2884812 RepID=UPI001D092BF9|nr:bile acid:sodium symporter [Streptomyces pinistramenti]MCB5908909.1 bile acid:sodium symporter [Streptomyces pinistramenti]